MAARVLMLGNGTIARTHREVLRRMPGVSIVAVVDPTSPSTEEPWFATLDGALEADAAPDLVVVATPTGTHVSLVNEVLAKTSARVLSEKPLASTREELDRLSCGDSPAERARVQVAHHFAFSPEVVWTRAFVAARPHWGRPERVESVFNDPYARRPDRDLDAYGSSWVDSAPNQLSMLSSFVDRLEVESHAEDRTRSATAIRHDGGTTWLLTNWVAADSSKQTVLDFGRGNQVRMDHTSMTVTATEAGALTHHVGYDGAPGRKEAHYLGLYRALFAEPDDERLGLELASQIVDVLDAARSLTARGRTALETLSESWPVAVSDHRTG